MSFDFKRKFYEALPISLKQSICRIPFSLIAGRSYRRTLGRGSIIDNLTADQVKAYQKIQLSRILNYAVTCIPAYRNLSSVVGRFDPFDALKDFPIIDKDTIQNNPLEYLSNEVNSIPHYVTTTGGTSGNQLEIYLDDDSQSVEMAFMHRQWARVGYTPRERKATFRGVSFNNLNADIYWQLNPIYNELQFSPFHMNDRNIPLYVNEIMRFRPTYLHGYPSAITLLAEYIIRHNLSSKLPRLKAILLGSEGCTPQQKERIESAFHTRTYSWYGHSERVILAGECEYSNSYHHFPDYGFMEICDDEGNLCTEEGDKGELIGTGFLNYCMPLIRYRTGDYATRLESSCECGRTWDRFTNVEGRWNQDMLIGKSGARISITALNMHGPLFVNVKRYQYCQYVAGKCLLKILPTPNFSDSDVMMLKAAFAKKTGDEVEFEIILVSDIPLTKRGKLKILKSKLL